MAQEELVIRELLVLPGELGLLAQPDALVLPEIQAVVEQLEGPDLLDLLGALDLLDKQVEQEELEALE